MVLDIQNDVVPHLSALRRVSVRYQHILPLEIMKRYQCVVVGAARGALTVAITDPRNTSVIEVLRKYTGHTIFPVWIEPIRMRLLIQRIERCESSRGSISPGIPLSIASQAHIIMMVLMSQLKETKEQGGR